MSTLAEIDAELARLAEILAEPVSWHSRRAREAENEQVRTPDEPSRARPDRTVELVS
jgi:hypothetical protein